MRRGERDQARQERSGKAREIKRGERDQAWREIRRREERERSGEARKSRRGERDQARRVRSGEAREIRRGMQLHPIGTGGQRVERTSAHTPPNSPAVRQLRLPQHAAPRCPQIPRTQFTVSSASDYERTTTRKGEVGGASSRITAQLAHRHFWPRSFQAAPPRCLQIRR